MNHKFINKYSEFILNETLKTHDIDLSIKNIEEELSLLRYDFSIRKLNNTILITLNNLNTTHMLGLLIKNLDNLLIDRHGWFPSIMILESISGVKNKLQYDREYFLEKQAYFKSIEILYEPRYDVELNIPKKLYHLSIQEYEGNILKKGLIPKSKSKLSKQLDRIYLCSDSKGCYDLIGRMKLFYEERLYKNELDKINIKWIIYEIDSNNLDIKLYKDPNYSKGYYTIENISPDVIKIFDRE